MPLATKSNATERAPRTAALVGANREMLALCQAQSVSIEAVIDPALEGEMWQEIPLYCDDTRYLRQNRPDAVVLGIDIPATRERAAAAYEAAGVPLGDVMATQPGAGTIWGDGLIMQFDAFLSVDTVLGRGVRMNVGATVMHDNIIGDFVTVAPRALLLGHVQVGARSYIGAHATVLPGIRVGEGAVVGAGAVVTRDVADGAVVKGSPAK